MSLATSLREVVCEHDKDDSSTSKNNKRRRKMKKHKMLSEKFVNVTNTLVREKLRDKHRQTKNARINGLEFTNDDISFSSVNIDEWFIISPNMIPKSACTKTFFQKLFFWLMK